MPSFERPPLSKRETQPAPDTQAVAKRPGGETPATKRERGVRRALRASGEVATRPLEGDARESPVTRIEREMTRVVTETRVLSETLGGLVRSYDPERRAREDAIRIEEELLGGKIFYDELLKTHREGDFSPETTDTHATTTELIAPTEKIKDHSNELWFMRIGKRALVPAIVKPARGEAVFRRGIRPGEGYAREWLAFMIDRALALGVVPTTIVRRIGELTVNAGDNDLASVQRYIEGDHKFSYEVKEEIAQGTYDDGQARVAALDYLTENTDRHASNELFLKNGRVVAIDHGLTFEHASEAPEGGQYYSKPMEHMRGKPIPEYLKENIKKLLRSNPLLDTLKKSFTVALGTAEGGAQWHWEGFLRRLNTLAGRDTFFEDYTVPEQFVITEAERETPISTKDIAVEEAAA